MYVCMYILLVACIICIVLDIIRVCVLVVYYTYAHTCTHTYVHIIRLPIYRYKGIKRRRSMFRPNIHDRYSELVRVLLL